MTETFAGGGYVPAPDVTTITPSSGATAIIPPVSAPIPPGIPMQGGSPERPDPFFVEGLRCAVQMFEPLDGAREMGRHEDALWWGNITRYADAMAAYLKLRSQGVK